MSSSSLWEAYGLQGNPFTTNPLAEGGFLPIEKTFIGRVEELQTLSNSMEEDRCTVFINGHVGVGKTSLLNFHKHLARNTSPSFFLAPRRELEATRSLLNKREFLMEVLSAIYGEIKLLDSKKSAQDDFIKNIAAMVDFASLVELTTTASMSVGGFVGIDATESRRMVPPMQLTIVQIERVLHDLIAWIRQQKIGDKHYAGVIIHMNNFDVVLQENIQEVRRFFNEIRDTLQMPYLYSFFLGPSHFYEEVVQQNARLRAISSSPIFVKPLSKTELNDAIQRRYDFLRSNDKNIGFIPPVSPQTVSRLYDVYNGDIRSVLAGCHELVVGAGGRARTLDVNEALAILGKVKWFEAEKRGIQTDELKLVLKYIASKPEGVTQKDVSKALGKATSNVSGYYFAPLKKAGLIEEGENTVEDKRLKFWRLTHDFVPLYHYREALDAVEKHLMKESVVAMDQLSLL